MPPDTGSTTSSAVADTTNDANDASAAGTGSPSPLYSTDLRDVGERIVVARTAADIQPAIDAVAERDHPGIVQLLPKEYAPTEGIELRGEHSVVLRGCVPNHPRKFHSETLLSGRNLADGQAIVRFRGKYEAEALGEPDTQADDCQLTNCSVHGDRKNDTYVHGVRVGFCGHPQIASVIVTECAGTGLGFSGTQSAQCPTVFAFNCGTRAEDTHPLDLGGQVEADRGKYHRATVIGSVYAGTGPRGDSAPIVLRNGSTLRIKASSHRTGTRVQDSDVPGIHIKGGDLVADNITVTTNLRVGAPGILLDYNGGGSAHVRNSVVEKHDPCLRADGGGGSFVNTAFYRGKDHGDGGHGFVAADSNRPGPFVFYNVAANQCAGDGFVLPRGPGRVVHGMEATGNGGVGVRGPDSGDLDVVGLLAEDNGGPDVTGTVFTPDFSPVNE